MHLGSRSTSFLVILATVIAPMAVLGAVLVGPAIAAPPSPPPNLDHFRCYSNTGHPALPPIATLEDQFDQRLEKVEEVVVVWPIGFCNPVAKTIPSPGGGPGQTTDILDPNAHLTMYEIRETTRQRHPTWKVTVDNQFGRQTIFATKPVLLGVPTQKVSVEGVDTGLVLPVDLNHFKCYEAKGAPLNAAVTLEDQFGTTDLLVVEPVLFCNPVTKTVTRAGELVVTPIEDPDAHLTCYNLKLATQIGFSPNINIQINNQFNHIPGATEPFTVERDERVLCVPSNKAAFLGMPGSFTTP
jgi:hypothetical protein